MVIAPSLAGVIERRLLVNFTVDAKVAAGLLPAPFEPQLVDGRAVASVCLIRLANLRPRVLPARAGLSSENAAHRFAVVRGDDPAAVPAVFIPRRDTSSALSSLLGGRLFPRVHHRADFETVSTDRHHEVAFESRDGMVRVAVTGEVADDLPSGSVFESVAAASAFFASVSTGWSSSSKSGRFDGLQLCTDQWAVDFEVERVQSSFFDDTTAFPAGSVRFDHALIMRDIVHTWRPLGTLGETPTRR